MARVFVTSALPGNAIAELLSDHEVTIGPGESAFESPIFLDKSHEFEAIVSLLTNRVDSPLLAKTKRLRVVANVAVGVDNIDVAACKAHGIVVTNTPGVLTEATADFAFALLLGAARRVVEGDTLVRTGQFGGWSPTMLLGSKVHGATLGIVGLGRIGQAVARRARGFGMHVLYSQRTRLAEPMERAMGATHASLDDLFEHSDFVSLHCPLTEETRHLVSRERLTQMKPSAILINTARGPCVDEAALVWALQSGQIAGAGLDVFEREPIVARELPTLANVVLAPHIASADRPTREAMARIAIENVQLVLKGSAPKTPVQLDP